MPQLLTRSWKPMPAACRSAGSHRMLPLLHRMGCGRWSVVFGDQGRGANATNARRCASETMPASVRKALCARRCGRCGRASPLAAIVPDSLTMRLGLASVVSTDTADVLNNALEASRTACTRAVLASSTARSMRQVACPPLPLIMQTTGSGQPSSTVTNWMSRRAGERLVQFGVRRGNAGLPNGSKSRVRCARRMMSASAVVCFGRRIRRFGPAPGGQDRRDSG